MHRKTNPNKLYHHFHQKYEHVNEVLEGAIKEYFDVTVAERILRK